MTKLRRAVQTALMWVLAVTSTAIAMFYAMCSVTVVAGSYFIAWAARMQHKLLDFFHEYGLADAGPLPPPADTSVTEEELEAAQRGDVVDGETVAEFRDSPGAPPTSGGVKKWQRPRGPRGQA